jgi:hypothetical protein
MVVAAEGDFDEAVSHHVEDERGVLKVEGGLRDHRLARQEWPGDLLRDRHGPVVVLIVAIRERD